MKQVYQKIVNGSKTHIYLFGLPIYYENRKENEIRRRFLWMRSTIRTNAPSASARQFEAYLNEDSLSQKQSSYAIEFTQRKSSDEIFTLLNGFDIISFDIFDTALLRKVEFPNDIFDIMSLEMRWPDFTSARKKAEDIARTKKETAEGHREITLDEIYKILSSYYNINNNWMYREIELEKQSALQNTFIHAIYSRLIAAGKKVIFTTDMYLPEKEIKTMLFDAGYDTFEALYVSNTYHLRKGDGGLQKLLLEKYPGKRIIHVGDNELADIVKSKESGIEAFWNPDCRLKKREVFLNNLSGSIYRAIINNSINTGCWSFGLHYTHGFRVGGILAAGFCMHINELVQHNNIDKILFCARDCYIIHKIYNNFYKKADNAYLEISRYAIMNIAPDRYANDILERFIFRYWNEHSKEKTLEQLLEDTGYAFLVPHLEEYDLDRYLYCCHVNKNIFTDFFLSHIPEIKKHTEKSKEAATAYFRELIGSAKSILVADIGWSGTCISAFEYFIHEYISQDIKVYGTLVCASDTKKMCNQILDKYIIPYISGPCKNNDFNKFIMPSSKSVQHVDIIHMPLEYMFTAVNASLTGYKKNEDGSTGFERDGNYPVNAKEIQEIQDGIYAFCNEYCKYTQHLIIDITISPYVAFIPLKESIADKQYSYDVYKNFLYDACTAPGNTQRGTVQFSSFFPEITSPPVVSYQEEGEKFLFVSPELTYTGTPRSLLRICRLIKKLGYVPIVWSAKDGPFRQEFIQENITVQIVPVRDLSQKRYLDTIAECKAAFCNTIVTDDYVRILKNHLPTIWFIREATNIPDFCKNKPGRLELLQNYDKIFCVSEYAAKAISKYTNQQIRIIHNCVEDESHLAIRYRPGKSTTIKFVQFGTMEYRKGYDILIAAYKRLPKEYQQRCELFFAGGFINSGTAYCDYIFSEMKNISSIHYLGIVKGSENKIKTLSQMDVVVVASRDESCSLVALEGAMLSRPLIVTENVGAKYMVTPQNGLIVPSNDVDAMKDALMTMIDNRASLYEMGRESRKRYEALASMARHESAFAQLFKEISATGQKPSPITLISDFDETEVIISLTSHPARVKDIHLCLESLFAQNYHNRRILLWLSQEQFPDKERNLPDSLRKLVNEHADFQIRWVSDDIKPHKKYYYACRSFPETPVIIVDDDAVYDPNMVRVLMDSYKRHPHCISCHRANLMLFRQNKTLRSYKTWPMGYTLLVDTPSYQLLPTGVGGVLYPPHSLPDCTFDIDTIKKYCLFCDDLWLKMMATLNNYPAVVPTNYCTYRLIEGSQESALWKENVKRDNNDLTLLNICEYFKTSLSQEDACMEKIRRDRFC